jgi:hypothetical protein
MVSRRRVVQMWDGVRFGLLTMTRNGQHCKREHGHALVRVHEKEGQEDGIAATTRLARSVRVI